MPLTNPNKVVTEERLSEFYGQILPYMGGMPEMVANKFSKGDLYSTDEKMIGQWTDGKPIYQKILSLSSDIATGEVSTVLDATEALNIDMLVDTKGWAVLYDPNNNVVGKVVLCAGSYVNTNYSYDASIRMTSTNTKAVLQTRVTNSYTLKNVKLLLQYTKTTDSPISIGSDTDYSTDEKVVGTWIDGKPIYQKTIDFGALPDSNVKNVNHGINNISKVVKIWAVASDNSNYIGVPLPYTTTDFQLTGEGITLLATVTDIQISTSVDRSAFSAYVTVQYTKTS